MAQRDYATDSSFVAERKKVKAAFSVFDRDSLGAVSKEEIGTIMRYLGCYPTETELEREILPRLASKEDPETVSYATFEPFMVEAVARRLYEPDSDETVLQAFRVLDQERRGYLAEDVVVEALTSNETAFKPEEIEDFLRFAKDADSGFVHYEDYVASARSA